MAAAAPFFRVKLGFENTPPRMYNANVTCAVLLSFVRTASIKDIDDYCKHKQIQLGVELDAIRKLFASRGVDPTASRPPSAAPRPTSGSASRPPSGAASSRKGTAAAAAPAAPAAPLFTPEQDPDGQLALAVDKKSVFERQLEIVTTASRLVKELSARTTWVDLADENGTRLKLDEAPGERVTAFVTLHANYKVVAVSVNDQGEQQVTPLYFSLPKYEGESPGA